MSDDTFEENMEEEVSRILGMYPTIVYYDGIPYAELDDGRFIPIEPCQAYINQKFEENDENDLTDEERLCYHDWELVGKSPVLNEEWWNCSRCGIAKEKYFKIRQREIKKKAEWRKNLPEIYM